MLSFEPRVGKVKTGLTTGGFTVIIPSVYKPKKLKKNLKSQLSRTSRNTPKKKKKLRNTETQQSYQREKESRDSAQIREATWVVTGPGSQRDLGRALPGLGRVRLGFFFDVLSSSLFLYLVFVVVVVIVVVVLGSSLMFIKVINRVLETRFSCSRNKDKYAH